MLAAFGIGLMEALILGLCCAPAFVLVVAVAIVMLLARRSERGDRHDG